ncbi:MAG TPA: histidine phosphatase family protein [Patescibacteria group bacterium]|nr:histidine phosphatase family protein [Patescibacteria group bacterium]
MKLYLIRHGESQDAKNGITQRTDSPLSEVAIDQLKIVKENLKGISFDRVFSSPFPRALQTAKELFPGQDIRVLDYLHEYIRPECLNGVEKEIGKHFWEVEHKEDKYFPDWKYDGCESFNGIVSRVKKLTAFLSTLKDKQTIAIVGHGVFFRHLIGYLLMSDNYKPEIFFDLLLKIEIANGGGAVLDLNLESNSATIKSINNFV